MHFNSSNAATIYGEREMIGVSKWHVEEKILSEPWKVHPFLNLSIECVEMLCASN
jgi:hypothetical protein